jgi:hypothetical protein
MSGIEKFVYKSVYKSQVVDFREELAPTPYLEGGLPLFTQLPRRTLLGDSMNRGKDIPW